MTIGLDINGRSIQSLRRESRRLIGRCSPAQYIALPPTDNDRRLLERAHVPYAKCDGSLVVYGQPAVELAPLLHVPCLPILPGGRLPQDDPLARQLAGTMVDALLPQPETGEPVCTVALPTADDGDNLKRTREWEFFSRLIRMRGYRPVAIDRVSAVALAQLGHAGFSGLTFILDDFRCAAAIVSYGKALVRAAVPRGLAWIDEQLARASGRIVWDMDGTSYVDFDAVTQWKRVANPSLQDPESPEADLLTAGYRELLHELINQLSIRCLQSRDVATLRAELSLVCCGEATQTRGFVGLLAEELKQTGLPFSVGEIRVADDPVFTVARGCLIRAELENSDDRQLDAA